MKKERNKIIRKKKVKVNGPDHCIHCDEDLCVFIQIETHLVENGVIYYNESEYEKYPVAYNSARGKHAFQYAAFVLWKGITNNRKPHYNCVEDGIRALFPPLNGKIVGNKNK
jgi:hypothetical protein